MASPQDRLTEALDSLHEYMRGKDQRIAELEAEVERLTKALEEIAQPCDIVTMAPGDVMEVAAVRQQIAIEALETEGK